MHKKLMCAYVGADECMSGLTRGEEEGRKGRKSIAVHSPGSHTRVFPMSLRPPHKAQRVISCPAECRMWGHIWDTLGSPPRSNMFDQSVRMSGLSQQHLSTQGCDTRVQTTPRVQPVEFCSRKTVVISVDNACQGIT